MAREMGPASSIPPLLFNMDQEIVKWCCNYNIGEAEACQSLGFTGQEPSYIGEFKASEKSCLKEQGGNKCGAPCL